MTNTNTNTNNTATLAGRAASLLSKTTTLDVVTKAIDQAINAKRVHPAMAQDFGEQIGHELPLKTRDFTRVVGHLLSSTEKPLKGAISKKKSEILVVLAEIVAALTDTQPVAIPAWAMPKVRSTKKAEAEAEAEAAEAEAAAGSLEKASTLAEAEANAVKAEKINVNVEINANLLERAVWIIKNHVKELTEEQRSIIMAALENTTAAPTAEAVEA